MGNAKTRRGLVLHVKLVAIVNELLATDQEATKREIYYQNEKLFSNQAELDRALDRLARTLQVPRDSLGIVGGCKGLVFGHDLQLDGISDLSSKPQLIPSNPIVRKVTASFALVVEKEAIFNLIVNDFDFLFGLLGPFLVITGKGYPCMATRSLVNQLEKIPVYLLVDFDPYGLEIAFQYRMGSTRLPDDADRLANKKAIYFGVTFRDIDCYGDQGSVQQLDEGEMKRAVNFKQRAQAAGCLDLVASATKMLDRRVKAEMEVIPNTSHYFTRNYLLEKLQQI